MKPDEIEFAGGNIFQRYYFENGFGASIIKEVHQIEAQDADYGDEMISQQVYCYGCEKVWIDHYKVYEIEEIN